MPRLECPYEPDVLNMVATGRWPEGTPEDLRAHAASCDVCGDLAMAAAAIGGDKDALGHEVPQLPTSGVVWWRAQLRARQEAAREVVRPITATQAIAFAAFVGLAGAVFGATVQWFQGALRLLGTGLGSIAARLPNLPSLPEDPASVWVGYWVILLVGGLGLIAAAAIISWAMKEE